MVPDVLGLTGRRLEAGVVRVLQGRDERSVRTLIPDPRVLEMGFHDVAIVDMGYLSEPSVSLDDLSLLRLQWPVTVLRSMVWLRQDLDTMRAAAKKRFRHLKPGDCWFCGKWIKCDMYRHVATYHLDLGQLWRCPVSWCTVWKGTPQDCMDHVRGHTMCRRISSRLVWRSFSGHGLSGARFGRMPSNPVSVDVLLFSDINLSLVHHYRVLKRGLPHIAFRKDYLTCLRVLVLQEKVMAQCDMASPVPPSSVSARHARSSEVEPESPRKTRRARRRMRPARVRDEPVGVESPIMTFQAIPDLAGAIIYVVHRFCQCHFG